MVKVPPVFDLTYAYNLAVIRKADLCMIGETGPSTTQHIFMLEAPEVPGSILAPP